jgi:hypothetical protein
MRVKNLITLSVMILSAAAVHGKDTDKLVQPRVAADLIACRAIADTTVRLACFDERIKLFDEATSRKQLIVIDETEMRSARRGLFGFTLPKIKLFDNGNIGDDPKQLDTTIADVGRAKDGSWLISLTEGGQWVQTDDRSLALSPKVGNKVSVVRGVLGSYFISINKQAAIKMSRVH